MLPLRSTLCALFMAFGAQGALRAQGLPIVRRDSGLRVIPVLTGQVFVWNEGDRDRVAAKDAAGRLLSESWCYHDDGTYDEIAAFFARFQAAVVAHQPDSVAALIRLPFTVNVARGRHVSVYTRGEFVSRYDKLFTPLNIKKIQTADPGVVYCHDGMAMLGDGVVWAHGVHHRVLADVLNQ